MKAGGMTNREGIKTWGCFCVSAVAAYSSLIDPVFVVVSEKEPQSRNRLLAANRDGPRGVAGLGGRELGRKRELTMLGYNRLEQAEREALAAEIG